MESVNKSRLSHQDSAQKTETKFVSPRKQTNQEVRDQRCSLVLLVFLV